MLNKSKNPPARGTNWYRYRRRQYISRTKRSHKGFDRVKGDQMGMLATVINSLAQVLLLWLPA